MSPKTEPADEHKEASTSSIPLNLLPSPPPPSSSVSSQVPRPQISRHPPLYLRLLSEMSLADTKKNEELKLENGELKHLILKLMSKYKTSEIKRNVLLKRNAMLIADNKNLHIQLLETTKKKIISEKAVTTYQEAVKLLKNELKELKAETSSRCDKSVTTKSTVLNQPTFCYNMVSEKPVQQKEESDQYFEVSDRSIRRERSPSPKSYDSPPQSYAGTYVSDDMAEIEVHSALSNTQKDDYVMCSDIEAYYQVPHNNFEIHREEFGLNEEIGITKNRTESLASDDTKTEENEQFAQKRDRLWAQIKKLREISKVTDEELQTRRFAVAAKAEMIQNIHDEIKRMQTLITITK